MHLSYSGVIIINACTQLQLLLGEASSSFLEGKFEPFSRYLAMGDTWRSATPSSCSPTPTLPTLPRAASAVLKPCLTGACFFLDFMPHHRLAIHVFLQSRAGKLPRWTLRSTTSCIYRMRASGACRDFCSRSGKRFQSIRPPSCPLAWLAPGRAACREHAGGVDAATFTNNLVIESMFFFFSFSPRSVPILY